MIQLNAEDAGNRRFILVQLPEACDENSEAYRAGFRNLCEVGKERIRRAGKKIAEIKYASEQQERNPEGYLLLEDFMPELREYRIEQTELKLKKMPPNLDIGFRVFKLDSSNLQTWDATPVDELNLEDLLNRMNTMVNRVKPDRSDMDMVCEIMLKLGIPLTSTVDKVSVNAKFAYIVKGDSMLLVCLAADISPEDVEAMAEYTPAKVVISRDSFANDTAMANAHYILRDKGIELKLV